MTKEKFYLIIGAIIVIAAAILGITRSFSGPEDAWLCQNGQWVKHGNPVALKPIGNCPVAVEEKNEPKIKIETSSEPVINKLIKPEIEVNSPLIGAEISSPLKVTGRARGNWYFEASFPINIIDENNNVLASIPAQAQGDWMTEEFVPFEADLIFKPAITKSGKIVFQKDNPSGDSSLDKFYEMPVAFAPVIVPEISTTTASTTIAATTPTSNSEMIIKVFFGSDKLNNGVNDCSRVFAVERKIPKIESVARASLEQLLIGPSQNELAEKYFTSISSGVKINSIILKDGLVKVDFDKKMDESVGGSCRVTAIRSQITQTLKQFSTIKEVIISVEGNINEALQP